jgi:hypothetical protein
MRRINREEKTNFNFICLRNSNKNNSLNINRVLKALHFASPERVVFCISVLCAQRFLNASTDLISLKCFHIFELNVRVTLLSVIKAKRHLRFYCILGCAKASVTPHVALFWSQSISWTPIKVGAQSNEVWLAEISSVVNLLYCVNSVLFC